MKLPFFLYFALIPALVKAEIYKDINALDNLGDVKAKFPSAVYEQIPAAWVTEEEALYKITGRGLTGSIIIKFNDNRPHYKKIILENPNAANADSLEAMKEFASQSDEDALTVSWVRWVPDDLIPLERFVLKHGKPEKSGFDDDTMAPYREWESKGIMVYLTDNGKYVNKVDFSFTKNDQRLAWKKKYKFT